MTDQPVNPFGNPDGDEPAPVLPEPSIIDTILDLDEMMSADVRRAEKSARFCTKPWLEAEIEELDYQLDGLTDSNVRPLEDGDEASVEGAASKARQVAEQIRAKQVEYAEAFRTVRVQAMDPDAWQAFQDEHKKGIEGDPGTPERTEMLSALIVACAVRPRINAEQLQQLRKAYGTPAFDEVALAAWNVNTRSGVSIPKSQLSSLVLRQRVPGRN